MIETLNNAPFLGLSLFAGFFVAYVLWRSVSYYRLCRFIKEPIRWYESVFPTDWFLLAGIAVVCMAFALPFSPYLYWGIETVGVLFFGFGALFAIASN